MRTLDSDRASLKEKEVIVKAFDDWDVLTPTWFEVRTHWLNCPLPVHKLLLNGKSLCFGFLVNLLQFSLFLDDDK